MSEISPGASGRRVAAEAPGPAPTVAGSGSEPAGSDMARQATQFDETAFAEAERRTAEACTALRQAARTQDTGDPLYAIPWFLAVGDGRAFLAAASRNAPFPRPLLTEGAEAPLLSWWLTEAMAAAAPAPALVHGEQPDSPAWRGLERLLGMLVRRRPLRPLDGLLALVPAETLSRDPAAGASLGRQVRAIAEEWRRSVGFRLPVFVIVTGLETLAGHQALLAALPREMAEKALGVRLAADLDASGRQAQLSRGLAALEATLARLRLGLLLAGGDTPDRRGVFRFPVDFAGLSRGMGPLVEALLAPDAVTEPAFLRGVYVTATAGSGAHLDDLVHRLLPADAGLCRRV